MTEALSPTHPVVKELKPQMPRFAKLLNVTESELELFVYSKWGCNETKFQDEYINKVGLADDMPPLLFTNHRPHDRYNCLGIVLRECCGIKYLVYHGGQASKVPYPIGVCVKGTLGKIILGWHRKWKLQPKTIEEKPVLSGTLYDDILENSIKFLQNSEAFEQYNIPARRGLLFTGSPGNGKSMLCTHLRSLCMDQGISYSIVTSADIDYAHGKNQLNDLFQSRSVLFFDDIDISYFSRSMHGKMACAILTAMDGVSSKQDVIRIFTTNEDTSSMDEAFLRPGRIDKTFEFHKPDRDLRERFVNEWQDDIKQGIDIPHLLDLSEELSFAELQSAKVNLVQHFLIAKEWDLEVALRTIGSKKKTKTSTGFGS